MHITLEVTPCRFTCQVVAVDGFTPLVARNGQPRSFVCTWAMPEEAEEGGWTVGCCLSMNVGPIDPSSRRPLPPPLPPKLAAAGVHYGPPPPTEADFDPWDPRPPQATFPGIVVAGTPSGG